MFKWQNTLSTWAAPFFQTIPCRTSLISNFYQFLRYYTHFRDKFSIFSFSVRFVIFRFWIPLLHISTYSIDCEPKCILSSNLPVTCKLFNNWLCFTTFKTTHNYERKMHNYIFNTLTCVCSPHACKLIFVPSFFRFNNNICIWIHNTTTFGYFDMPLWGS